MTELPCDPVPDAVAPGLGIRETSGCEHHGRGIDLARGRLDNQTAFRWFGAADQRFAMKHYPCRLDGAEQSGEHVRRRVAGGKVLARRLQLQLDAFLLEECTSRIGWKLLQDRANERAGGRIEVALRNCRVRDVAARAARHEDLGSDLATAIE